MTDVVGVAHHPVPNQSTEKIVDRHAEPLAANVPERDVDGRKDTRRDASRRKESAPEHDLPEVLDSSWILANQNWLQVLDDGGGRHLATGDSALADAVDSLVGIDDDEKEVARASPNRKCLDIGDLHDVPPLRARGSRPLYASTMPTA